jgi:4-carboxymuconolactone decarboxylase
MSELPEAYQNVQKQYPQLMKHYEALGQAAATSGPLDAKSVALVKLAMCLAADLEGGAHSAVRKALEAGCTADELRHVAVLGVTTLGFPAAARARAWVEDLLT